jgi:uncharacterized protein YndB with AHSA1/START domain
MAMATDNKGAGPVWKPPSPAAAAAALGRELRIDRLIKAPREMVWAAWTEAEQLARWWGPHGFTNPVCEMDPKAGGRLHIVMRGPDGVDYVQKGVVRTIKPPAFLEFTVVLKEPDGSDRLENLTTLTLEEDGEFTRLRLNVRVLRATPAAEVNVSGMEAGWNQSLDRLIAQIGLRNN